MARTIRAVDGNSQRLDGGSMFGNCPRALWERWMPPDEQGRIPLACRGMLVEDEGRRFLFEAGIGVFFEPALRERFGVVEDRHVLMESLAAAGAPHETIDVVVLSHLHFDHAGGLLTPWEEDAPARLLFPRARFLVSRAALERAAHPHLRDRASFIPVLPGLLEASGRLEVVEGDCSPTLGAGYRFHFSEGHTPGLMLTEVDSDRGPVLFAGDLIPGIPWVHLPITMGYDRFPERLIEEKRERLEDLLTRDGSLFFTHDPEVALARVVRQGRDRFRAEPVIL
jgi:glyoxylase-like metal-dependent hydrolase (beta-lactamase superfamily II)